MTARFKTFLMLVALPLTACAMQPTPATPRLLLLGEVHDNAEGHRLRFETLQASIEAGWRPAIAMEQFDTEQQAELTQAQARCGADARCVIRAAEGKARWDWPLYEPVIALAQRYQLPLLAANLSRSAAAAIARGQPVSGRDAELLSGHSLDALPADLLAGQTEAVRSGHCNLLPERALTGMARAQVARDIVMAEVLRRAGGDAVLLAGNGHVRRDLGVPRWLPGMRVETTGFSEQTSPAARFDREILIRPQDRPDPCASLPQATAK